MFYYIIPVGRSFRTENVETNSFSERVLKSKRKTKKKMRRARTRPSRTRVLLKYQFGEICEFC